MAAKLSVGYSLDQIPNDITKKTPASFEPSVDYMVIKVSNSMVMASFICTIECLRILNVVWLRIHNTTNINFIAIKDFYSIHFFPSLCLFSPSEKRLGCCCIMSFQS